MSVEISTESAEIVATSPQQAVDALRQRVWGGLLGLLLVGMIALLIARWKLADPTPNVDVDRLKVAFAKWEANGPEDYDIEIKVAGNPERNYLVEVRQHEAVAAFINGSPLRQRRTFATFSVLGMFATIERDLQSNEPLDSSSLSAFRSGELTMRGEFDPVLGFPRRYQCTQAGTNWSMKWEVIRLEKVVDDKPSLPRPHRTPRASPMSQFELGI